MTIVFKKTQVRKTMPSKGLPPLDARRSTRPYVTQPPPSPDSSDYDLSRGDTAIYLERGSVFADTMSTARGKERRRTLLPALGGDRRPTLVAAALNGYDDGTYYRSKALQLCRYWCRVTTVLGVTAQYSGVKGRDCITQA